MSSDPSGTQFTGIIDTTDMHRGWVSPTVVAHATGYSYLQVAQGEVYVQDPPSQFYKAPIGVVFLLSLLGILGLFAVTAVLSWQTLIRKEE